MAVDIDIDIDIGKAMGKVEAMRLELKSLEDTDFDLDEIDIDGIADGLDGVAEQIGEIKKQTRGLNKELDGLQNFEGIDVNLGRDDTDGTTGGVGGGSDPPADTRPPLRMSEFRDRVGKMDDRDGFFGRRLARSFAPGPIRNSEGQFSSLRKMITPEGDLGPDAGSRLKRIKRLTDRVGNVNRKFSIFGRTLKRLKPSMRFWHALVAAIIPLLITFAVQALGVAAAMGAVAVAGAAVIGLGLAGHGDDMAESFANARKKLGQLKDDLFEVFQPSMRAFAPITDEFMDFAPGELTGVADSMEGLTAYKSTFFSAFSGMADWVSKLIDLLVQKEEIISQLAMRFGEILGNSIIDFLGFLFDEAYQNQEMLIRLGDAMLKLAIIAYEVSEALTRFFIAFSPLLDVLVFFAELLNTPVIGAMLSWILVMGWVAAKIFSVVKSILIMQFVLNALGLTWGKVLTRMVAYAAGRFAAMQAWIWSTIGALSVLRKAMALTGIGLVAIGAGALALQFMDSFDPGSGPGDGGGPGGGGTVPMGGGLGGSGSPSMGGGMSGAQGSGNTVVNNYNSYELNHTGDMSNDSEQRIRSTIKDWNNEQDAESTPDNESDGNSN